MRVVKFDSIRHSTICLAHEGYPGGRCVKPAIAVIETSGFGMYPNGLCADHAKKLVAEIQSILVDNKETA